MARMSRLELRMVLLEARVAELERRLAGVLPGCVVVGDGREAFRQMEELTRELETIERRG